MRRGSRVLSALLALALVPPPVYSQPHLVSRQEATDRLQAAATERRENQLVLDRLLADPAAAQVAAARGVDIRTVRAGLARLSDAEVHDLARRAEALKMDPASAGGGTVLIILVVVVVVVVLLAIAVVEDCKEKGAECIGDK